MIIRLLCLWTVAVVVVAKTGDYYDILGVANDADDRTIRKAFKKLAMTHHPDKNKGNDDAHDIFVKINRAYEVLKDGELRKKYDVHGEEGLKDGFQGGQQYQSWQFYKDNFGIYDNDDEIVTLSAGDFEQLVTGTDDKWFINFYSTGCSHCHQLAPAWRQMASELDGVLRVGAVNCADEWMFCRERQIFGYPSLIFFPGNEVYQGDRAADSLIAHALNKIAPTIHHITEENVVALSTEWEPYNERDWVVDICVDGGEDGCLSHTARRKLAAMLQGLMNVGTIDCTATKMDVCEEGGVFHYPRGKLDKAHGTPIESLDAKEIATITIGKLPDMTELDDNELATMIQNVVDTANSDAEMYMLVHFVATPPSNQEQLDMKKLPALLGELVQMGRVDCKTHADLCDTLHIRKTPAFAVFKPAGGFELHYGKSSSSHDIAAFVRSAIGSNLRTLGADEHDEFIVNNDESAVWLVDFFAPWCPPCQKLLPEVRKAARQTYSDADMHWATVDCTVHSQLCQRVGVHTYPTTIVYNNSVPNTFVGLHSASQLIDFIDEIRHPLVITLDDSTFGDRMSKKVDGEIILVDFFAPWCGPCMELAPQWRRLAKMLHSRDSGKLVTVVSVDCTVSVETCRKQGISGYPTIRLFFADKPGFDDYRNWFRDAQHLRQWVSQYLPSKVRTLATHAEFMTMLESERPHIVDFFTPWCQHCTQFAPEYDVAAELLDAHGVTAVKVNCDALPSVCQLAAVRAYPTVRFYVGLPDGQGGSGMQQMPKGMDIQSQQSAQIEQIIVQQMRTSNKAPRDEL